SESFRPRKPSRPDSSTPHVAYSLTSSAWGGQASAFSSPDSFRGHSVRPLCYSTPCDARDASATPCHSFAQMHPSELHYLNRSTLNPDTLEPKIVPGSVDEEVALEGIDARRRADAETHQASFSR